MVRLTEAPGSATPGPHPGRDRERAPATMSALSDSGFDEDARSPSPGQERTRWAEDAHERLAPGCDEGCFMVQRNREEHFQASLCLARQPQVTAEARCKLVSWLIGVYKHFELSFESCCLAVNIVDRFLLTTPVAADCFQLLGVTALLIATKQVEICSPRIQHLLSLCCDAFSKEQLCNLEFLVLLRLDFRLAAPTLAFFLDYFVARELPLGPGVTGGRPCAASGYKRLACVVCELSLADVAFNGHRPSVIAASAVGVARELLRRHLTEAAVKDARLAEMLDALRVADDGSGSEDRSSIRQCTEELRLLVSLNHEAVQNAIALCNSTEHRF